LTTIPTQPVEKRRGFMARYGLGLVLFLIPPVPRYAP
jgi:hypothetical protein